MVEPATRIISEETGNGIKNWARIDQHDPVTDMVEAASRTASNPASSNGATEKDAAWILI